MYMFTCKRTCINIYIHEQNYTHTCIYIYIFHLRYLQKRADISDSNCLGSCIFFLFSVLHCLGLGLCHASQLLISFSSSVRDLGVTLDSSLTFAEHISNLTRSFYYFSFKASKGYLSFCVLLNFL